MEERLQNSLDALRKHLANMTEGEKEEMKEHFRDKTPKGWNSIEDYLPGWKANDLMKGYTEYKVKSSNGEEVISYVTDHNTWYYMAKEEGITHWFNE